ncbi:hypothetical protein RF11_01325 [Thelohanellus kitauei]|uniref:Uncharacterized protein n=1 Tax=Thelohanellus kitauei TaxID=669202 RepID=A0A0C2N0Z1_THEKT|nr:hypothetical protein RF11_01325 [Thelohanellus kitauei]
MLRVNPEKSALALRDTGPPQTGKSGCVHSKKKTFRSRRASYLKRSECPQCSNVNQRVCPEPQVDYCPADKHDRAKETIAHCSLEYKPGEFFSVDKAVLTFREYVGQNHLDILIVSPELRTIWIVECQLLTFTSSTRLGASKTHSYVHWANTLKQAWLYRNIVVTDVFLPLSSNDRAIIDLAHVVHDPRVFAGHCHKANINFAIIILKCFGCGGVKRLSREGTRPE